MKTKLLANIKNVVENYKGNIEITLEVSHWNYKRVASKLEQEEYVVELNQPRNKRSNNQNRLLWEIIHQITDYEQGMGGDEMITYTTILELANCKYEYMMFTDEAAKRMKEIYRIIKYVGNRSVVNEDTGEATEVGVYKCFIGSSKFNTEEMNHLIDIAIKYASEIGLDVNTL